MITDPLFYALAIPAVIALGLAKGGLAGVGQVATPVLALLLPPLEAAALLLPIMMVQDAISVWVYRRQWSAWNLKVMLPGALIGTATAWALASYVSDGFVRLGVGLISFAYVFNAWFGKPPAGARAPRTASGVFWGALSGFTSTMAQAGGPPFQIHVLPQRLEKLTYVGTNVMFFAVVNVIKVVPYFALGNFTPQNFTTSVALFPLAAASSLLGVWLVRRVPTVIFYKIAHALIFLISLELIRAGTMDLLR